MVVDICNHSTYMLSSLCTRSGWWVKTSPSMYWCCPLSLNATRKLVKLHLGYSTCAEEIDVHNEGGTNHGYLFIQPSTENHQLIVRIYLHYVCLNDIMWFCLILYTTFSLSLCGSTWMLGKMSWCWFLVPEHSWNNSNALHLDSWIVFSPFELDQHMCYATDNVQPAQQGLSRDGISIPACPVNAMCPVSCSLMCGWFSMALAISNSEPGQPSCISTDSSSSHYCC